MDAHGARCRGRQARPLPSGSAWSRLAAMAPSALWPRGFSKPGTGAALGVIPQGTGNDFARVTGIYQLWTRRRQLGVVEIVKRLAAGPTTAVDVLSLNDQIFFICYCGVGWDALVCQAYTQLRRHPTMQAMLRRRSHQRVCLCHAGPAILHDALTQPVLATRYAGEWLDGWRNALGCLCRDREQCGIVCRRGTLDSRLILSRWPVRGHSDRSTVALCPLGFVAVLAALAALLPTGERTRKRVPALAPRWLCTAN